MQVDKVKLSRAIAGKGMLISEVQRAAGLNVGTMYRLVKHGGPARLSTIGKVAKVLGVDIMEIVVEG